MKILILGISGRTGKLVASEALRRGHNVVGIARNPEVLNLNNSEIIRGTPYDFDTVRTALVGCNAVISVLSSLSKSDGLFRKIKTPLDIMSVSMKNTIRAMKEKNIQRIVVMTALGVGDSAKEIPVLFRFMMRMTNIKYSYIDHDAQEKVLEESNLNWTVVRPVMLTDKSDNISILYNIKGVGKIGSSISRQAVANFMIDCIEKEQFIKQKPGISNS